MFIGGEEVECDESSDGRGVEATVFAPNSVLRIDSEYYQNQQQRLSLTGDGVGSLGRAAISDGCWERTTKEGEKVPHLIILQHGYLGSVRDMSLLRNTLATLLNDEDYEDEGNGDLGKENKEDLIQVDNIGNDLSCCCLLKLYLTIL